MAEGPLVHHYVKQLKFYLLEHPHLKKFVKSPNSALLRVKVDSYYVVKRFQNVIVLSMQQ